MATENIIPSDSILFDDSLTVEDREAMQSFTNKNRVKRNGSIFDPIKERENVERLDFAIKAILQHLIKKRGGGNGNT